LVWTHVVESGRPSLEFSKGRPELAQVRSRGIRDDIHILGRAQEAVVRYGYATDDDEVDFVPEQGLENCQYISGCNQLGRPTAVVG
jgi:hypothetical protein